MNFQDQIKNLIKKATPYLAALAIFWTVSALYFAPQLAGDTLSMTDVQMYGGMKQDISDHRANFGEDPQWTGGMFGGMPAYLITVKYPAMILRNGVQWLMGLMGEPMSLMFLAMTGFWLMLLLFGVNPWLAIPFALAYGLSTYNILIIEAGHITKMRAMGYAPMLVGAIYYTFRRGVWLGGALAALFGTLTVAASHHQITYYFLLIAVAFWLNELTIAARARARKTWRDFCIATAVLAGAALLAVGANFTHIWYTFEHAPDTIRGGSEVATATADNGAESTGNASSGLDLDYATAWSYGTGESVNMFIPNFRGGASTGGFAKDGEVAKVLRQSGIDPAVATQLPGYWGDQPFTGGPTYLGAVAVFLFILGMFLLPSRTKWWVLAVSIFALLLAWGRNAMWFTELNFAMLPGYNKFRTVAMSLAVLQWSVPFVAALTASGLWHKEFHKPQLQKGLLWSLALTAGTALIFALGGPTFFSFASTSDAQFDTISGLVEAMQSERAAMLRTDCLRSFALALLTATGVWLWFTRSQRNATAAKITIPAIALTALILIDLVPIDLRFLSHADFRTPSRTEVTPDEADLQIMDDPEPGFRVMNTENPFNEALTSYFHRSVGGYHAAKLRRYQDVIDRYLSRFDFNAINMLNTKYFLVADPVTGERTVELNPDAFGAAWFVSEVVTVDSPAAELEAIGTTDLRRQAIVDQRFAEAITANATTPETLETATIQLTDYRPNYLKYSAETPATSTAVFSEIYYDKGWTAYIDGREAPYFRADYILRAMTIPAGNHVIEWRFRAPRFAAVEAVTLASSIAVLLWLVAAIYLNRSNYAKRR